MKKIILAILILILGGQIYNDWEYLHFITSGKWIKEPDGIFEIQLKNIRYKGVPGNMIDDSIFYNGAWEPYVLSFLEKTSVKTFNNNGIFLDIGANTGWHSLSLSKYSKTVHAIEPYPPILVRLEDMIALNGIDNIQVHPVGFSNKKAMLTYYAPPKENLGTGSFDPKFSDKNRKSIQLPLVIGDDYLLSKGITKINLIKVDIEGYERYALQGLKKTLFNNRPIVVLELNYSEGGFKTKDQLFGTFPPDYKFFKFKKIANLYKYIDFGRYRYVIGKDFSNFSHNILEEFDFNFNGGQADLAAVPIEKFELIKNDYAWLN